MVTKTATRSPVNLESLSANAANQVSAIATSTAGYCTEMRSRHPRQRPPSATQLRTGTFSYQVIGRWQRGQCERGATTDSSIGQRAMQTLRNDPMSAPQTETLVHQNQPGTPAGADPTRTRSEE